MVNRKHRIVVTPDGRDGKVLEKGRQWLLRYQ
jgi:hypothetical protein